MDEPIEPQIPFTSDSPSAPEPSADQLRGQQVDEQGASRATKKMVEERVVQVAKLLINRVPKHQIKKALKVKYGLGYRSAEAYIARAREYLIEQSQRPKQEWIAEMLGVYEQGLADPAAGFDQKCSAADRICRLLGLDQPIKIAPTNPEGDGPAEINLSFDLESLSDDELRVLRKLRNKARAGDVQSQPIDVQSSSVVSMPAIEGPTN